MDKINRSPLVKTCGHNPCPSNLNYPLESTTTVKMLDCGHQIAGLSGTSKGRKNEMIVNVGLTEMMRLISGNFIFSIFLIKIKDFVNLSTFYLEKCKYLEIT